MATSGGPTCGNCGVNDGHSKACLRGEKVGGWISDAERAGLGAFAPPARWSDADVEALVRAARRVGVAITSAAQLEAEAALDAALVPFREVS